MFDDVKNRSLPLYLIRFGSGPYKYRSAAEVVPFPCIDVTKITIATVTLLVVTKVIDFVSKK